MESRLHLSISGDVQGVFFRANAESVASRLSISGWVRNKDDGSVELVAEGDPEGLRKLLEWCKKGPAGARVERVDERWGVATGEFRGFRVIR